MSTMPSDPLATGAEALRDGRWTDARSSFEEALLKGQLPEALGGLGEALWWLGDLSGSVRARERAYTLHRRAGRTLNAARTAVDLAIAYYANYGNHAAAGGWVARAAGLIEGSEPGPVHGWVWLMQATLESSLERAQELAQRAVELARGISDPDLELVALADLGVVLVAKGFHADGLPLIDQALAAALAGEGTRLDTVVLAACDMLIACDMAGDLKRAAQWCRVAEDFARKHGSPFLYTKCRTIFGGMLLAAGDWVRAEEELVAAIRMAVGAGPSPHARAVAFLAELRLRQGRLEEAEAILGSARDEITTSFPAARLHLARGEAAVAVALLERSLDGAETHGEAAAANETLALAYVARGDVDAAQAVATRLAEAADDGRGPTAASAAVAAAHVATARGDLSEAAAHLESALNLFSRLDLRFEAARARLLLAGVLARTGARELAAAEARRALDAFDALGAAAAATEAAALLRSLGVKGRTGPKNVGLLTKREQEVLRLVGSGLSNPEIAERLFISRKTTSHHVSAVLAKLGLRNRAEAVVFATRTLVSEQTQAWGDPATPTR